MLASLSKKLMTLAFLCGITTAQAKEFFAEYQAIDTLTGKEWVEIWVVEVPEPVGRKITSDKILTKQYKAGTVRVVEMISDFRRVRVSPQNKKYYLRESLVREVLYVAPGEGTFGHMEIVEADTGKIVDQWPIFVEKRMTTLQGIPLERTTYKSLTNSGIASQVIQDYVPSQYPFPVGERRTTRKSGETVEDIIYLRIK